MSRQGEYEVFDSESGLDYESWEKWMACNKNPGHSDFISVENLTINDIPEKARCKANFDWIKVISDLTVRIRVKKRSSNWCFADFIHPGFRVNQRSYFLPLDNFIHSATGPHSGTGRILNVYPGSGPCPCHTRSKGSCSQKWWGYNILTAKHVVFGSDEACWTNVDLFYEEDASGEKMMKTLYGVKTFGSCIIQDWCNFQAVSHDENLADTINWALLKFWNLRALHGEWNWNKEAFCTVIVSHPHGQPKKVTFGVQSRVPRATKSAFHYTAATCPGSSGAGVFPLLVMSVPDDSQDFAIGQFGIKDLELPCIPSDSNCVHSYGGKHLNTGYFIKKMDAYRYMHTDTLERRFLPSGKLLDENSSEYKQFFW